MRIIFDLQPCQSDSRFRGIGRNAIALTMGMARQMAQRGHDVWVALNAAYSSEAVTVEHSLRRSAPDVRFTSFRVPTPCAPAFPANTWRQRAAELLREHALASLAPDFVHLSQLVADGWCDDTVTSVGVLGVKVPTALTHHDLIPLVMSDVYLPPGPYRDHYLRKMQGLKRADLLLAVSEFSRQEAIERLGLDEETIVTISSGVSPIFGAGRPRGAGLPAALSKFGLSRGYLLYAPGGYDARKNLDRLIEAFAALPEGLRRGHPLVLASRLEPGQRERLRAKGAACGLQEGELVLTDFVPDEDLADLYAGCHLYVFPSLHEGFGLPALEAMACGAPVIASDRTGIPEAVGMPEALFDPYSVPSITEKTLAAIADDEFRKRLIAHAEVQPHRFSWERSAAIAVEAVETKHRDLVGVGWRPVTRGALPSCNELLGRLAEMDCGVVPDEEDLREFRECYESNLTLGH